MAREPNARLAEVMRRADCSNSNLALRVQRVASEHGADVKCTHVDVGRWLNGVLPRPATAQFIAIALSRKAGTRSRSMTSAWRNDDLGRPGGGPGLRGGRTLSRAAAAWPNRRELAGDSFALGAGIVPAAWPQPMLGWLLARPEPMPARAAGRIKVGESDVAAIRTTVELFMRMDFQFGGGHARAALAQYFANDVCPLLDGSYTDQVGRHLFSAAAQVAQLLGWTAYDIGRHVSSRSGTSSRGCGSPRPGTTA